MRVEESEGVATVTLNRPEVLNALSVELTRRIAEAFRELQSRTSVGAVILTGAGRGFCAGVDLRELGQGAAGAAPRSEPEASGVTRQAPQGGEHIDLGGGRDMLEAVSAFDRPVIGAINGVAITGGFELALMCDLLVASREARFADTHARVGIVPGWGLSQKLSRWIGIGRAKEISLTGNFVSAEQAEAWGLVNRVVAPEELLPVCRALARDMLSCDPVVVREYKRIIDAGYATTLREGMEIEQQASDAHLRKVSRADVEKRREAVQRRGRDQARGGA